MEFFLTRSVTSRAPRRGAIAVSLATLLGMLSLALAAFLQDWYVDIQDANCGTGTGTTPVDPFCNIMDAVTAAADGDTIHIAPGTYLENVVLDKDLTLIGTGGDHKVVFEPALVAVVD